MLVILLLGFVVGAVGSSNWVIIAATSRYWYNYRHTSNALSVYKAVRQMGIPDSQILLLLAGDVPCSVRSPLPGAVMGGVDEDQDVLAGAEVDLSGDAVNMASFISILTGRQEPWTPPNRRLHSGPDSNLLIYLTGHGGEDFVQWQDWDALTAGDIAAAIEQLAEQKKFKRLLFIVDSCQAGSMSRLVTSRRVLSVASSRVGESSYSRDDDGFFGAPVTDRFTAYTLKFLEAANETSSMADLVDYLKFDRIASHVFVRTSSDDVNPEDMRILSFFGGREAVRILDSSEEEPLWPIYA